MQIIPTNRADMAYGIFSTTGESSGSSFFDAMTDALDAVQDGDYASATAALEDESRQPLVESPYTRHTTDGVTYTLSEVCFTKQELHELRAQLLKEGAPEECLRQFDILADQPDGATLAQVMASLMGRASSAQLSDDDEHAITALLGQIDPTGQLAVDALTLMRQGNGSGALDLIENGLANMGTGMGIDIDRDSLLALGRGLGLNQDSLNGLLLNFGQRNSMTLNADQFGTLMTPAKNQFLTEAANSQKLDAALEKTLKPIISKARDRMEKEKAASELANRRVEQTKVLIDRTVQQNSRDILDETLTGEAAADARARMADDAAREAAAASKSGETTRTAESRAAESAGGFNAKMMDAASNRANAGNTQLTVNEVQNAVHNQTQANGDGSGNGRDGASDQGKQQSSDGWQSLLGRTSVQAEKASATTQQGSIVYSMIQGSIASQNGVAPEASGQSAQISRQVASQVEQAILTTMRNGATRMDLQLNQAELGNLAITLIARNGEVTAQIRSERSETAEMMTRELETMRVNLEQQGIKVDKIEVQLESKGEDSRNSFDNLGEHNSRQEENAFRQETRRLRTLANLRNNMKNEENSVLAQSMHDIAQTARYAGRALHVVA